MVCAEAVPEDISVLSKNEPCSSQLLLLESLTAAVSAEPGDHSFPVCTTGAPFESAGSKHLLGPHALSLFVHALTFSCVTKGKSRSGDTGRGEQEEEVLGRAGMR